MYNNFYFRRFCFDNFPFLEKDFDALTDYELISKIFEYLEKQIKEVDEKYAGFGDEVESLKIQFQELQTNIYNILNTFQENITNEIYNTVDSKLQEQYATIVRLLADYQTVFNTELTNLRNDLEQQIEEIELGNVMAYNPTNRISRKCIKSNNGRI